ncbi:hypothetical protein AB0L34_19445 [Micromonospora sp. NPDC052213]|uniref:hypothetical protein n=1 Tax=Micromonospora sp. NPDC052213 TaxID=3155812 RepID=UPI00343A4A86
MALPPAPAHALYDRMYVRGEVLAEAQAAMKLDDEALDRALTELRRLGLLKVQHTGEDVPVSPEVGLADLVGRLQHDLHAHQVRLANLTRDVETLAQTYLPVRRRPESVEVEILDSLEKVDRHFEELGASAADEVLTMLSWRASMPRTTEEVAHGVKAMVDLTSRGVATRTIFVQRFELLPRHQAFLDRLVEANIPIRLLRSVPVQMAIYDRHTAVLPLDPERTAAGAVAVRGELLVRSLVAVFEHCWLHGHAPRAEPDDKIRDRLTAQHLELLRMQAAGAKDDAIGRALGVSSRTVSRLVSEVHEVLGSTSRFQAGVTAARLGLLD